jgi:hypothetical protein
MSLYIYFFQQNKRMYIDHDITLSLFDFFFFKFCYLFRSEMRTIFTTQYKCNETMSARILFNAFFFSFFFFFLLIIL